MLFFMMKGAAVKVTESKMNNLFWIFLPFDLTIIQNKS